MGNLNALRKSGLPITWNTIWIGCQAGIVAVDELQSYACDLLGIAPDAAGYLVFRLFDADPTNRNEMRSALEQLAGAERVGADESEAAAREEVERIWNVAAVQHWLDVALSNRWRLTSEDVECICIDLHDKLPFSDRSDAVPTFDAYLGSLADYDDTLSSLSAWAAGQVANLLDTVPVVSNSPTVSPA